MTEQTAQRKIQDAATAAGYHPRVGWLEAATDHTDKSKTQIRKWGLTDDEVEAILDALTEQ